MRLKGRIVHDGGIESVFDAELLSIFNGDDKEVSLRLRIDDISMEIGGAPARDVQEAVAVWMQKHREGKVDLPIRFNAQQDTKKSLLKECFDHLVQWAWIPIVVAVVVLYLMVLMYHEWRAFR